MTTSPKQLLIGAHTSAAGGAYNALLEGKRIGATTIQFFTANQRRWESKPLEPEAIKLWHKTLEETGLKQIMSHDSYLINLGAPDPVNLAKSRKAFAEEAERCTALGVSFLNFHPGCSVEGTTEECLDKIAESILLVQPIIEKGNTRLLLENTAGQGSAVGWQFEHLAYIIKKVEGKVPIGVCLDTCHLFVAGYDIRTPEAWEATLQKFDSTVGLKNLRAFHVNDSIKGLGSRVDRHMALGKGAIGIDCFKFMMQDARLRNIPKYLETPDGPELWVKEIQMLREFAE